MLPYPEVLYDKLLLRAGEHPMEITTLTAGRARRSCGEAVLAGRRLPAVK
jgi:hypothetical protein